MMVDSVLNRYLSDCIAKKKFPGGVCWIGNDEDTLFFESYGHAQIIPRPTKLNKETIFDLASITKPLATALTIMLLYDQKELRLDDRLEQLLPNFKNKPNGKKTIKELLIHTSGIPAWLPIYLLSKNDRLEFLAQVNTGKKEVMYSCLGYIILGKIIEQITKEKLDKFCRANIFKKIGLKNTMFGPIRIRKNVAATEFGNEHEKQKASKYGDISKIRWRNYIISGEVHDGNSFYGYDGISGNAGLFSNASDLARIARALIGGEIVKSSTLKMMIKDHTGGKEQRGLGWLINPYPGILSSSTFCHTGFTGTMLTIDPRSNLIIILLTNAVHPKVRLGIMPKIRRKVVRIIANALNKPSRQYALSSRQ